MNYTLWHHSRRSCKLISRQGVVGVISRFIALPKIQIFANKTDTQSIPTTTNTKATFNVEVIDTDSAFSSSRFTVPSGEGGKYYFFASAQYSTYADQKYNVIFFYVNGSVATKGINYTSGTSDPTAHVTYIADLSASDYIEVYVRHNLGSDNTLRGEAGEKTTYFGGYKLIG